MKFRVHIIEKIRKFRQKFDNLGIIETKFRQNLDKI